MILADRAEPEEMLTAINQSVPCQWANLNLLHMSDYYFCGRAGSFQFSRKQSGELLSNLDEAEDQLRDYYHQATFNFQIIEGLISPVQLGNFGIEELSEVNIRDFKGSGGLFAYKVEMNGYVHGGRNYPGVTGAMLYTWFHRLAAAGVPTYFPANWGETTKLLVSIFNNEQKLPEEHSTLQRVIVPKLYLKDQDPFVKALVALSQALKLGIGEITAVKLRDAGFTSVKDILDATRKELMAVPSIGKVTAERLHVALGRRDE